MGETAQAKEDFQVTGELGLLSEAINDINTRVDTLGDRLQKVMMEMPTTDGDAKQQPEKQLCDVAQQIKNARQGARKVHRALNYILDNLQL